MSLSREELKEYALKSSIINKWHFFGYHFNFLIHTNREHPLVKSILDLVSDCEQQIPGVGKDYIDKLSSINERPNAPSHYDKLLQVLAELLIVHKALTFAWGNPQSFQYEPTIGASRKNPELVIETDRFSIGIEVKSPDFVKQNERRQQFPIQLPARSVLRDKVDASQTLLPRDNPIKDFLISANQKFSEFKRINPNFVGILVIVGDDFIYETITALISPLSGLFTEESFAKNPDGTIMRFENVDGVVVTRHLHPIIYGTQDRPLPDSYRHPIDYGRVDEFPFKVLIPNPNTIDKITIPDEVWGCFQTSLPSPHLGAEYVPADIINWY